MSIAAFRHEIGIIADLLSVSALLAWDMRTVMPAGGVAARGQQMATVAQLARDHLLSDNMHRALDLADASVMSDNERREIDTVREAIAYHERIPAELVSRRNMLKATAQAAWAEARRVSDFGIFAPLLAETVALARELADAIGYDEHPHDALLQQFEPGATGRSIAPLFNTLRHEIGPLLAQALDREPPTPLPRGPYAVAAQQELGRTIAARFGYDFARGRLDPTVHPFELAMTRYDVRITARYNPHILDVGLKAAMHETGHGLYEQNLDPALNRTALNLDLMALSAMGGASLSVHESQSRLWENHVGRSLDFWRQTLPLMRAAFPVLGEVGLTEFHRAFNVVRRSKIRTEADELSYDFHIMLRTELERALIEGSLNVGDLPRAWNDAMHRDLGITIDNDAEGVLQDIHWSMGQLGSFVSYTVGNVLAAQIFKTVQALPGVSEALGAGDYAPLRLALTENIYRHGRRHRPNELIELATGGPLQPGPYVHYLKSKYEQLYDH